MLPLVLMPGVAGSEIVDHGQPMDLHPDEAAMVAAAGGKRRRDFALGRLCAHDALAKMDRSQDVLGSGPDGAPLWRQGICGSITHTIGYAAAIVAGCERFAGIGVDAEHVGGVTQKLWPRLFDDEERAMLGGRADHAIAATILFSAKEASFKAQGSASGPLADIHVELAEHGFLARSKVGDVRGLYAMRGTLVLTTAYWPRR